MSQPHASTDGPWNDPQTHLDTDPVNADDRSDEQSDDAAGEGEE